MKLRFGVGWALILVVATGSIFHGEVGDDSLKGNGSGSIRPLWEW